MSIILTQNQQNALLDQPELCYPVGLRNRVQLQLALKRGLRTSEQIALMWKHVDLCSGQIWIRGINGTQERGLCVSGPTRQLLTGWNSCQQREWNKRCPNATSGAKKPEYVFTTLQSGPISKPYIRNMVRIYANEAGIDKNVTPDCLRKTFASELYERSQNIRHVQHVLGFEDLTSTMIYLDIVPEELDDSCPHRIHENTLGGSHRSLASSILRAVSESQIRSGVGVMSHKQLSGCPHAGPGIPRWDLMLQ